MYPPLIYACISWHDRLQPFASSKPFAKTRNLLVLSKQLGRNCVILETENVLRTLQLPTA
jgi:hypothetical protein